MIVIVLLVTMMGNKAMDDGHWPSSLGARHVTNEDDWSEELKIKARKQKNDKNAAKKCQTS